jgi:copper resistance protein D
MPRVPDRLVGGLLRRPRIDEIGWQVDEALILCRALQYTAAIALFGLSAFMATVPPSGLARLIEPPLRRAAATAIILIAVTTVVWLLLEAGEIAGGWLDAMSPETISALLFETEFGRVWQWRLAFAAILLFALAMRRYGDWRLTALWSALALASLGFVGHGAIHEGALGWLNRASHALHLLAAGAWLGSLVPLLYCLPLLEHPDLGADAAIALRRFSALGSVAVATVLITGVANTWLVLGGLPSTIWSPYQALLIGKIAMVAAMIGLALVNRLVLTPRLGADPHATRWLRINTISEVALGLGAVGLVSIFGTLAPA